MIAIGIVIVLFILLNASGRSNAVTKKAQANPSAWAHPATRVSAQVDTGLGCILWVIFICAALMIFGIVPAGIGLSLMGGK